KQLIRKIGRTGQGPGDLLGPRLMALGKDGELYVQEYNNQRISVFSSEGSYLKSFRAPIQFHSGFSVTDNNMILCNAPRTGHYITVYNGDGEVLKNVGKIDEEFNNQWNIEYCFGYPFYVDDKFYLFPKYSGSVLIFNQEGVLEEEVELLDQIPVFRLLNTMVDPQDGSVIGGSMAVFHQWVDYRNDCFFIQAHDATKNSPFSLHILDKDLKLQKLVNISYPDNDALHNRKFKSEVIQKGLVQLNNKDYSFFIPGLSSATVVKSNFTGVNE
ncbi:hypothetical protein ACFL67_03505, partial [candidate division KSB1 bacterium]